MPVSIKDLAKRLNLSVSTVSYALNGGPRPVSEDVRERVLALAKDLNYRPNRVARSMVTRRSRTIGIVPPEVGENVFLGPYLQFALNGIANEAGRLHHDILLFTSYSETHREEMLDTILDGRADGVIFISPGFTQKSIEVSASCHVPSVILSGSPLEGVLSFSVDNQLGVAQAMSHLYDLGHRKIAHIAGRLNMLDAVSRMQAYQSFLDDKRLPYRDEWMVPGRFMLDGGREALIQLMSLKERPTAVFCANDEMAIGAIYGARALGLRVPEDVSIVGFDSTTAAENCDPKLTTVAQPIGELAAAAVRALLDLVESREPHPKTVFETALVVRASTTHPTEEI